MAEGGIRIRVEDEGYGRALEGLLARTANLEPVWDEIGAALVTSAELRFEDEADPEGNPWPALAAATTARRGAAAKKLRDAGHLYQSLTHAADRLGVAYGTARRYGRIHQLGGKAGRGRKVEIPARPYLGVSEGDRRTIGDILTDSLAEAIR